MKKKYDELHASSFIKGLTTLTGLSERKLKKYANENNLFNVLEHPNIIDPNKQQREKINMLNEFISSYKLLKLQEEENKLTLNSSSISGEYFISLLGGIKDKEKFMAAFLDSGNNIIETRTISEGSIGETIVYPRNILKAALVCDCKSIILAHNHPGGNLKPSSEDMEVTERLISIFSLLQINVVDHIIVANSRYCSMAERGCLPIALASKASCEAIALKGKESINEEPEVFNSDLENRYETGCNDYDIEREDEDEWEI